jgi:hypothetical protein
MPSLGGVTTVVAKRYNHRYLAEEVYNDLTDLMVLLETLGVPVSVRGRMTHMHDMIYKLTLEMVATRFTRMANEKQYEESLAQHP